MIPLLIRWTLGCNYQSWWGWRKMRRAAGDDFSPSLPFRRFVSQRRRGIDSYYIDGRIGVPGSRVRARIRFPFVA